MKKKAISGKTKAIPKEELGMFGYFMEPDNRPMGMYQDAGFSNNPNPRKSRRPGISFEPPPSSYQSRFFSKGTPLILPEDNGELHADFNRLDENLKRRSDYVGSQMRIIQSSNMSAKEKRQRLDELENYRLGIKDDLGVVQDRAKQLSYLMNLRDYRDAKNLYNTADEESMLWQRLPMPNQPIRIFPNTPFSPQQSGPVYLPKPQSNSETLASSENFPVVEPVQFTEGSILSNEEYSNLFTPYQSSLVRSQSVSAPSVGASSSFSNNDFESSNLFGSSEGVPMLMSPRTAQVSPTVLQPVVTSTPSAPSMPPQEVVKPVEQRVAPVVTSTSVSSLGVSDIISTNPSTVNSTDVSNEAEWPRLERQPLKFLDNSGSIPEKSKQIELVRPEKKFNTRDWVIGGLEALSMGLSRNEQLKNDQEQAFRMQQREQAPMFYSGYYGNRGETTIGRNQGLIMAEDGAIVRSTNTGLENALVEQGEHLFYPNGTQATVGGEKHSARVVNGQQVGGTRTNLPNGTMIFSDKLKVPNTNKTFASMAKKLGSQIEKYTEITSAVGKRRVDVETAEIMLTRAVRSLDELFKLQQSINGNHGEDYVDTVDSDEAGDMPIAGKGMMYYQNAGKTNSNASKIPTPKTFLDLYGNVKKDPNKEEYRAFRDLMRVQGLDVDDDANLTKAFQNATNTNKFLLGLEEYANLTHSGEDWLTNEKFDITKGKEERLKIINEYLGSDSFKSLGMDIKDIPILNSEYIVDDSKGRFGVKPGITTDKLFNSDNIGQYQKIYRGAYKFTSKYKKNPEFNYLLTPEGVPDQMMDGAAISPVDFWLGNTTIRQVGREAKIIPPYEEKKPEPGKEPMTTAKGSNFEKAKAVEPSKYTGRPFDPMQLLPNVFAMNQNIAPYVTPEVKQLRVSPYEQYVDPWVQDAYTAAIAASSLGADPNAMFINAQQNVDKIQSQKRNQDTQADFQARMQNVQMQRQADMFNEQQLGAVNNQMVNIAKSNKAKSDFDAMQNAIRKKNEYERNEANIALNFQTMSPGYNFDANTLQWTVNQSYQDAMMNNLGTTPMDLIQFFTPEELATAQARKAQKTKKATEEATQ